MTREKQHERAILRDLMKNSKPNAAFAYSPKKKSFSHIVAMHSVSPASKTGGSKNNQKRSAQFVVRRWAATK